jgi:YegS/Rv2252/BmrU family lipid kinase
MPWPGFLRRVAALDRALYRRVGRVRAPLLDASLRGLSRAADRSLLWVGVAAGLALSGGRGGRIAAVRALLAVGLTSAVVNGPLKQLAARRRPGLPSLSRRRIRRPRSPSFPSGHTASAFAFATATSLSEPRLLVPLAAAAAAVGFSRVYLRVHYPGDVLAGALIGLAAGTVVGRAGARRAPPAAVDYGGPTIAGTRRAVLVFSPSAGRARRGLGRLDPALRSRGLDVIATLPVSQVERLPHLLAVAGEPATLVLAAGGDGTVGAVADQIAGTDAVLAVVPLGTSNDFARSIELPIDVDGAVDLLWTGRIANVDLGRIAPRGERPLHFVHAATVGSNVHFAKVATRPSVRRHLGRLTYAAAAAMALREHQRFTCTMTAAGRSLRLELTHLFVINAPVFGGFLRMRVAGARPDDRMLDVVAMEDMSLVRLGLAMASLVVGLRRRPRGLHHFTERRTTVHTERRLEVTLDGEVRGCLPADFEVVGQALRVVAPRRD